MKLFSSFLGLIFVVLLSSGCSSNQSKLESMNADVCNNPKCKCPKPCQCGSGCRCGMDGNPDNLNGREAK